MAGENRTTLPTLTGSLPTQLGLTAKEQIIVDALVGYKQEAVHNRKSGMNPRDPKWQQNSDLYWNRYDFSDKASWQSQTAMPEVPSYVDRFAAALKNTLNATPSGFYTVEDPYDTEADGTQAIKKMTDVWLSTAGRSQVGTTIDFSTVFEEQMKLGALMATSAVVVWRDDVPGGRVSVESVDPRFVWLDHTYRNLYRIRRTEVDLVDLMRMAGMTSSKGNPLFNNGEIQRLVSTMRTEDAARKAELSGGGEEITSNRRPIVFDEFIASVVDEYGNLVMDEEVVVLANDQFLIRGPEKNPYWHGKDWLTFAPLITVPMSPYGRSYMEDFGSIAKVFTDMTNLLLDAAYASSMNAFAIVPDMLKNPEQASSGIWPRKSFMLEEGQDPKQFAVAIEMGRLDSGAIQIWQALKAELSESAGMNEIALGKLPDKSHIAATAVQGAQQSSGAILQSVAHTIETRFIDPVLDLVWKTGLQHASKTDVRMAMAVGEDMYRAMLSRRRELIKRPITFQAKGISGLIQRQQQLQALLQVMQIVGQNENLMQAFMAEVDINKLLNRLFEFANVDLSKLSLTERERMMQQAAQAMPQPAGGPGQQVPQPGTPARQEMKQVAQSMGVQKGGPQPR